MGSSPAASLALTEKLKPDRSLTRRVTPALALQFRPSVAPRDESCSTNIRLLAVTAEVLTVVDTALGGITKAPAAADPQTAGLVLAAHFLSIPKAEVTKGWPVTLQIVPGGQAESIDAALLANSITSLSEAVPWGMK